MTTLGGVLEKAEAWNALLDQSDADPIFMSLPWLSAWWRQFGDAYDLLVYVIAKQDLVVGIIPLIRRKKEGFRQLCVAGVGRSDYQDFLLHPAHADACMGLFMDEILPAIPDWDLFQCTRLIEGRTTPKLLRSRVLESRFKGHVHAFDVAPYAALTTPWTVYRDEHVRKKIVKDSERQHRRLARTFGPVSFKKAETKETFDAWFPELVHFHQVRRNQVKNDFSMFNDPAVRGFYASAAEGLMAQGQLAMDALFVGEALAALHLGFRANGRFYYTLPVMNQKYEKYSVGRLLLLHLMAERAEEGDAVFDFGYGDESYKYDFTSARETMLEVVLVNRTAKGRAAWFWHNGVRKKIKENEVFMGKILPRLKTGGLITEGS